MRKKIEKMKLSWDGKNRIRGMRKRNKRELEGWKNRRRRKKDGASIRNAQNYWKTTRPNGWKGRGKKMRRS